MKLRVACILLGATIVGLSSATAPDPAYDVPAEGQTASCTMQDGHKLSMLRFTSKNRNFPTYLVCLDTPQHWRVTMPDRRTEYVWKFDWGKPEHFHWALYPNECKTGCAGPVRGTRTDRGSCYVLQINQVGNEALRFRTLVQAFKDGADSTLHFQVGSESVVRGPKLSSRDLPRR